MDMTSALEAAQNYFNIDLRLNTAYVDRPWFGSSVKEIKWFSFDNYMHSPSGTTSSDFLTRPLFSANLRVAIMQRIVEVRYQTWVEAVNETAASWGFATMACTIVWFALAAVPQAIGCCKEAKGPPLPRKLLATEDEVTVLKKQLQQLQEALGKATGVELPEATEPTKPAKAETLSPPAEP